VLVPVSWIKTAVIAAVAALVIWLFQLWQPARQVDLHTLNLLQRASARDWPAVERMMSPDYRDAWGHDRRTSIDEARLLFSHFFALQITATGPWQISGGGDEWSASGPLGVFGSGSPVAHVVIEEVRAARGVFEFRWRKSGSWPWAWLLVEVRHEDLAARDRR
jgi:hypothetical protein